MRPDEGYDFFFCLQNNYKKIHRDNQRKPSGWIEYSFSGKN